MGLIGNVPYRPAGTDPRSIAGILSNFDQITAEFDGNIDSANLAVNAVGTAEIAADAVTAAKIAADAVGASEIAANAVGSAELATDAVTADKIAAGAVGASEIADGAVNSDKPSTAMASALGLTQTGTVRRGKSIIATEQSRTNIAYGTLTTPDQVSNVVLPTDGLIVVAYQALWKRSTALANAAIFIGTNQLKGRTVGSVFAAPQLAEATIGGGGGQDVNEYTPLASASGGLRADDTSGGFDATSDVTTGQFIGSSTSNGGVCHIFAAAGTYTISVQFKATSGSVTAKERKLWVWTMGF